MVRNRVKGYWSARRQSVLFVPLGIDEAACRRTRPRAAGSPNRVRESLDIHPPDDRRSLTDSGFVSKLWAWCATEDD
ncbi:hypothetical protein GCM10009681_25520 [Luedemannella helvata]|uniref:Uncharacterized protein n=1 Tax=Luedemannella helvata TaxID=349315 RepID=A0ABN3Y6B7_9ACTN